VLPPEPTNAYKHMCVGKQALRRSKIKSSGSPKPTYTEDHSSRASPFSRRYSSGAGKSPSYLSPDANISLGLDSARGSLDEGRGKDRARRTEGTAHKPPSRCAHVLCLYMHLCCDARQLSRQEVCISGFRMCACWGNGSLVLMPLLTQAVSKDSAGAICKACSRTGMDKRGGKQGCV